MMYTKVLENQLEQAIETAHGQLDIGDAAEARDILEKVLALSSEKTSPLLRAQAMGLWGVALHALEQDDDARDMLDRAIRLLEVFPASDGPVARILADLLEDRAELALSSHAHSEAQRMLTRAIETRRRCNESIGAETWLALSEAMQRMGEREGALSSLDHAESAALDEGDLESVALSEEMRADIELEDPSSVRQAAQGYASAEKRWRELEDSEGVIRCLLGRVRAAERCDDEALVGILTRELDAIGAHDLAHQIREGDIG